MRVLMLTTSYPLYPGHFAGLHVHDLARHEVKTGVEVEVLAPGHPQAPPLELRDGVRIRRIPYIFPQRYQTLCYGSGIMENIKIRPARVFQVPFLLLSMLVQTMVHGRKADILHAHWPEVGLVGLAAARILGKPLVITMHHGQERGILMPIFRNVLENADLILCNSSYTLEKVLSAATPRACAVVPPGVDIHRFRSEKSGALPVELSDFNPANHPILFTLGRLIGWKGYNFLLDALTSLPEAKLVMGGDGPLRQSLVRQAERLGLADRVRFLGHISSERTPEFFNFADVFVQPSIVDRSGNTEGLGLTPLEAMACCVPCVGSRVGGIVDTIHDGRNGFLVRPEDSKDLAEKINRLIRDPELRNRMGREARRFVEDNYAWEAVTCETVTHYRKILS